MPMRPSDVWSEVEGKIKPGMWTVGARTLPHSITNQASTSTSNEQGPGLWGQLFMPSQLGEMELERRGAQASLNPTILPNSALIFCSAASIHTTKSKHKSCLDGWSVTLKSIHEWPFTLVAILQQPWLLSHSQASQLLFWKDRHWSSAHYSCFHVLPLCIQKTGLGQLSKRITQRGEAQCQILRLSALHMDNVTELALQMLL